MALVRILVDGYSLLHNWPELAPGKPRHSAAARDELIRVLTLYRDAVGTPLTIVFDGAGAPPGTLRPASTPELEVLYSGAGQTADDIIERVAYRMKPYGEVLAVTDDYAERDTVLGLDGLASSCGNFILDVEKTLREQDRAIAGHNRRERGKFLSVLCIFLVAFAALAQPQPQTENRFLFVINTSSAMRKMSNGIQEAVLGLIKSGMQGQMRDGDTFGIWNYDDQLHSDVPLAIWTKQTAPTLAEKVGEFLSGIRFEKKAHLDKVMPYLHPVMAQSRVLTVIFIFDGTETMEGVMFDKDINDLHKEFGRQVRADNVPFVTVLSVHDGKIFDYRVRTPAAIALPQTADFFTNTPPVVAVTNVAPPVVVAPPPPTPHHLDIVLEPTVPRKTNPPVTVTEPAPPEKAPTVVPPVPVPAPAAVLTPTNLAAVPAEPTNSPLATASAIPVSSTTPPGPESHPIPTVPPESAPVSTKEAAADRVVSHEDPAAPASAPKSGLASSIPPPAPARPMVVPAAVALPSPTDHAALLVIAFSLVMIAGVLLVFLLRRTRTPPSLISQSLDRAP